MERSVKRSPDLVSQVPGSEGPDRQSVGATPNSEGWLARRSSVLQAWTGLRPFVPGALGGLLAISLSAVMSGLAQAGALYLLVEVSVTLAKGNRELVVGKGSLLSSLHLGTSTAILTGLGLVGAFL